MAIYRNRKTCSRWAKTRPSLRPPGSAPPAPPFTCSGSPFGNTPPGLVRPPFNVTDQRARGCLGQEALPGPCMAVPGLLWPTGPALPQPPAPGFRELLGVPLIKGTWGPPQQEAATAIIWYVSDTKTQLMEGKWGGFHSLEKALFLTLSCTGCHQVVPTHCGTVQSTSYPPVSPKQSWAGKCWGLWGWTGRHVAGHPSSE